MSPMRRDSNCMLSLVLPWIRCSEDDCDVARFAFRAVERFGVRSVLRCPSRSVVRRAARAEVRVGVRPVERAEAYEVEREDACDVALVRDLELLRCCECAYDCERVCECAFEPSFGVGREDEVEAEVVRGWDVERARPASVRFVPVPRVARNCLSPRLGIYFPWAFKASTSSPPTTVTSPAPMVMTMSPGSTRLTICGTTSMRRGT